MLTLSQKIAGFGLVGLISIASLLACAQEHGVRSVTVCELYEHSQEMAGMRVRLSGIYTTDRFENTTITDSHCPKVRVAPYDANNVDAENMKRFDDAVAGDLADSSLRVFSVDLLGKFMWRPNEKTHGAIYIEKVLSFKRLHNVDPWKQQAKPSK